MEAPFYGFAVREYGSSSSIGLTGTLLVSHPNLLDPNFRRTVVFVASHLAHEGSLGFVLNRPAGRTVGDLLPTEDLGHLGKVPVFIGGPVGTDELIFTSFLFNPASKAMECRHHLPAKEALAAATTGQGTVRAFLGYSGWSKGQLEAEIAQNGWLLGQASREALRMSRCSTLWRETTSAFGPWFQFAAEAPEDPALN